MKRRSFLRLAPAAAIVASLPKLALSADSPIGSPAADPDRHQGLTMRIVGAGTMGLRVTKTLQDDLVASDECLYGAVLKPNAELGSRLLVVSSEGAALPCDKRARAIRETDVLVGVCALGSADRFAVSALEELAYMADEAGVDSPVAIVALPRTDEDYGCRQRSLDQLQEVSKVWPTVIPVDADRLMEQSSGNFTLENPSSLLERHMATCVATIRSMMPDASGNRRDTILVRRTPSIPFSSGRYAFASASGPEAPEHAPIDALRWCRSQFPRETWTKVSYMHAYTRYGKDHDSLSMWRVFDELSRRADAGVHVTMQHHYRPAFGPNVEVRLIAGTVGSHPMQDVL